MERSFVEVMQTIGRGATHQATHTTHRGTVKHVHYLMKRVKVKIRGIGVVTASATTELLGTPDAPIISVGDWVRLDKDERSGEWVVLKLIRKNKCAPTATGTVDVEIQTANSNTVNGFPQTIIPETQFNPPMIPLGSFALPDQMPALPVVICGVPTCPDCIDPALDYVLTVVSDGAGGKCLMFRPKPGGVGGGILGCTGSPTFVGTYNYATQQATVGLEAVTIYCNYGYALCQLDDASGYDLYVFDVTNGAAVVELSHQLYVAPNFAVTQLQVIDGTYLLALGEDTALSQGTVAIWDLTDPTNPVYVTNWADASVTTVPNFATQFGQAHSFYAATSNLVIYDITDPTAGSQVAFVDTLGSARGASYNLGYLYAMGATGGNSANLFVVDVANPASPGLTTFSNFVSTYPAIFGQVLEGGHLYAVGYKGAAHAHQQFLTVIDVTTDPTTPSIVTTVELTGTLGAEAAVFTLTVCCHHLYITGQYDDTGEWFVLPIEISNPASPVVGTVVSLGASFQVDQTFVFYNAEDGRLYINGYATVSVPQLAIYGA